MQELTKNQERNLIKFRKWAHQKSIGRVIQGFLPNFIDDDASDLALTVDEGLESYTDGKRIWVSLIPYFLDDQYVQEDWLIVLKCMIAHEAQHVNSSNFTDIKQIMEWFSKYMKQHYSISHGIIPDIAKSMLNIVEDGRIESIAVKRRPGMLIPFKFVNEKIRAELKVSKAADNPGKELSDFMNSVLSYAKTGLYMPGIQVYAGTRLEQAFLKVVPLIDEGVEAVTSADCRKTVEKLLQTSADYIAELVKNIPERDQSESQPEYTSNQEKQYNDGKRRGSPIRSSGAGASQTGGSSEDDDSESDSDGDANASGGEPEEDGKKSGAGGGSESDDNGEKSDSGNDSGQEKSSGDSEKSDKNNKKGEGGDKEDKDSGKKGKGSDDKGKDSDKKEENSDKTDGRGRKSKSKDGSNDTQESPTRHSPVGFEGADTSPQPLDKDKLNEIKQMMARTVQTAEAQEKALNSQNDNLPDSIINSMLDRAYKHRGGRVNQKMIVLQNQESIDTEMALQAKKLRREIQKIQEHKTRNLKGLRRGALDSSVLWKVGTHSDAVFEKRSIPDASSCAFYLLLDNSGSMHESIGYSGGRNLHKYEAARYASSVIEAAVAGLVPCKIALFNYTAGVNHSVIRTFDDKSSINRSWNSLKVSEGVPAGGNCDSVNIRIAAEELKRRREKKKILLVLSDGEPSAYNSYSEAYGEVRDAVKDARRAGVIVIPIMFGDLAFLKRSYQQYAIMYEKDILISQPKDVINDLTKIFRILIQRS